ncbi:HlyD family secretion protein [Pokkaliibacter sp. MBI-7]|uniref:HlyD family secretion protein n=1 Tax=Pokkaliibacter sp. MBI-7 TaxID=3040600 RepID=UPI0024494FEE|nr:HlyD family secretion protein [Pokkaliibacter sp. MBI-7]MDH2431782.1 HlyD family secretion protein [Pokkaliibacter sp. MBI-7]
MNKPVDNITIKVSTISESNFSKMGSPEPVPAQPPRRKALFTALGLAIAIAGAGSLAYWELTGSQYEETDNAYTAVESAQVMSAVTGTVADVLVKDSQSVKKGDVLVVIDPADARLALAQAEANLDSAIRRVKSYQANDARLGDQVSSFDEEIKRLQAQQAATQADLKRASIDLQRRKALVASGAVSGDELTQVQNAYASAQASVNAAKAAVAQAIASRNAAIGAQQANAVLIDDATLASNPEVALARAKRDQAQLDLDRTVIRSPVDGIVARRQVELGQRVQPSSPLLTVVPVQDMYVEANFKEIQLKQVQAGQKVELISDLYGKDVVYHGVVEGFDGGTGAAFGLIPAQNATGNWIKVVQRLPVRVSLDPVELQRHPLRVGLTMTAKVDLHSKP